MNATQCNPCSASAHLRPAEWTEVNRRLMAKALAELAHERLIEPRCRASGAEWSEYSLATDSESIEYQFRAAIGYLDHWTVDGASIRCREGGRDVPLDALRFIVALKEKLAIPEHILPEFLQELSSTLYGAAYKHVRGRRGADELAAADFQELEAAMTEGHPIFIANNGRLGWSTIDSERYAPEAASEVRLVWLAARRERADFACVRDLSYSALIEEELGAAELERLSRVLVTRGSDPSAFVLLPVHPWQWENRVAQLYAPDLASGDLVYLGSGEDRYRAQQSIRTFFNASHPHKRYVKTALSIVNMGFTRSLSPAIAESGARVNDWIGALVDSDPYFKRRSFSLLREVAFVGFRHRHYEAASTLRVEPYKEMLAALWRESPMRRIRPGQRLMTMAALLHLDSDGRALLPALIRLSGLPTHEWLRRYLRHYLEPLVHAFYAHHLTFTPHCENTILVLEDHAVAGVILKDLAEDIGVMNPEAALPAGVQRLALSVPEELMTLAIFTDVFDCVFRLLAPLLSRHASFPEESFWALVAECLSSYQAEHPELEAKFARYDLFAPTFLRNCLNRLQLRNNRLMVDLNAPEPVDSLQLIGTLDNPIAAFRAASSNSLRPRTNHGSP